MIYKRQIIIIGSGISGFAAALAATNEKTDVLVFDCASKPGGQATHVNVGTICGLFSNKKLINHPFLLDFVERYLCFDSSAKIINHAGYDVLSYDWKHFESFVENEFDRNGIRFFANHEIVKINADNANVRSIETKNRETGQTTLYNVGAIIDCTGKAIISELLNAEMIKSESYQAPAYVFAMENVKAENEFTLSMILNRFSQKNKFPGIFVVPGSLSNGKLTMKLALEVSATDDDDLMSKLLIDTKQFVSEELIPNLIRQTETFQKAKLTQLFPDLGIRTCKRALGKHRLTEEDLMSARTFDDTVAIGSWPMEEWDEFGKVEITPLKHTNYAIPSGCMRSVSYDNLFFGGKTISADEKAISSARVMGICLQTGYAAGRMAVAENEKELTKIIQQISHAIGSTI